jgi:hypothetical protein
VIAFDSKDFERPKLIVDPITGQKHWAGSGFYSPLGLGVVFSDDKQASSKILAESQRLMPQFRIESLSPLLSGTKSAMKFGFSRVIRFYDTLLQSVQDCIKETFSCHVVLPPAQFPFLDVGGVRCPRTQMKNSAFLRELGPAFSYLTAWYYFGKPGRGDPVCHLDSFTHKQTVAWEDLSSRNPSIYSRGDECNPLIALADILAFLTDKKLRDARLKLTAPNVEKVWEDYGLSMQSRYLDYTQKSKYSWYSNEHIDTSSYLARPIVFVKADGYNIQAIEEIDRYPLAVNLALQLRGCIQGFDKNIDSVKVRDGDIFVYAGEKSRGEAETLQDMHDIEILSFKQLPDRLKKIELS